MAIYKSVKRLSLLVACAAFSLWQAPLKAQVQRYNATGENNYGIVYTLPKTKYEFVITTKQCVFTPGELSAWGSKYLGKDVGVKSWQTSEILDAKIRVVGVPNIEKQYLVAFDKKTIAPFVNLAPGGVIYSINGKNLPAQQVEESLPTYAKPNRALPSFPKEYSLAITQAKRAEIASTYLYDIRENLMNIVSGEVDQMPKDGESMRLILDKLRGEEQRTLRLFEGDTTMTAQRYTLSIEPKAEDMEQPLAYLSPISGFSETKTAQDAKPITLRIKIVERSPELDPKELARREKSEGIVYNLPGIAEVSLVYDGKELAKERLPITQVGTIQTMSKKMFNIKEAGTTAIYFDLNSGALNRVTTE